MMSFIVINSLRISQSKCHFLMQTKRAYHNNEDLSSTGSPISETLDRLRDFMYNEHSEIAVLM